MAEAVHQSLGPDSRRGRCQLEHGAPTVRAAIDGGAEEITRRVEDDTGDGICAVRNAAEDVQQRLSPGSVSGWRQLKHRATVISATAVIRRAVEAALGIEDYAAARIV